LVCASAHAQTPADLANLSIEELGEIQVTSVSKRAEPVRSAPSAIYVITRDDIARAGARTIPEMLRLAPNLQVAQTSASGYMVTARGFSGNPAAQNFSNKLLVLIDGRSVYTPLYSGVYWDMQGALPADIERIEVISGPGATLWGANAVNGVINIITRKSGDTQGGVLQAGVGSREGGFGLRYGGRVNDGLTYRLYVHGLKEDDAETAAGASAGDDWSRVQAGFRVDWEPQAGQVMTLQGDAYDGSEDELGRPGEGIEGQNLLARWTRSGPSGATFQVQAYYDRTRRASKGGGEGFTFDTYDIDVQHSFTLGDRHAFVWGGGLRRNHYRTKGAPVFFFEPASRGLTLSNLFVQDSISLTGTTRLVLGMKVEDGAYLGAEVLPSARLSWEPSEAAMVWAAVSRAVRAPTPFDRDVVEVVNGARFLTGGPDYQSEKLTAYEIGLRGQPSAKASFSVSAYYNVYDDLRSVEFSPVTVLPLRWGNGMKGHTYGLEAWGEYRATPWWRLAGGYSTLRKRLKFEPGSSGLLSLAQAGDDPRHQASLKSSMDLGPAVTLDAAVRYVGALPDPRIPSYVQLDGRVAWNVSDRVQLSLSGRNLLHDRRQEFPEGAYIPRSVFVDMQLRF
jgi:iron complex outermembrane receptor protein